jgi:hypothetical protein
MDEYPPLYWWSLADLFHWLFHIPVIGFLVILIVGMIVLAAMFNDK